MFYTVQNRLGVALFLWVGVIAQSLFSADNPLELAGPGSHKLTILTPNILELSYVNTKAANPARVTTWDFVNTNYQFQAPGTSNFAVTVNGQALNVIVRGFKRRPLYAPLARRDLRIQNSLYLQLSRPLLDNEVVQVRNPNANLWPTNFNFSASANPLRPSEAIHVNQEGYAPSLPKKAMLGLYMGSAGELFVSASLGFKLLDAQTGAEVYQGAIVARSDLGWPGAGPPYQRIM